MKKIAFIILVSRLLMSGKGAVKGIAELLGIGRELVGDTKNGSKLN